MMENNNFHYCRILFKSEHADVNRNRILNCYAGKNAGKVAGIQGEGFLFVCLLFLLFSCIVILLQNGGESKMHWRKGRLFAGLKWKIAMYQKKLLNVSSNTKIIYCTAFSKCFSQSGFESDNIVILLSEMYMYLLFFLIQTCVCVEFGTLDVVVPWVPVGGRAETSTPILLCILFPLNSKGILMTALD